MNTSEQTEPMFSRHEAVSESELSKTKNDKWSFKLEPEGRYKVFFFERCHMEGGELEVWIAVDTQWCLASVLNASCATLSKYDGWHIPETFLDRETGNMADSIVDFLASCLDLAMANSEATHPNCSVYGCPRGC